MCNFIHPNSFPLGLEKGNNHFSTIWSAALQVMRRMLFPVVPSSHSGSAVLFWGRHGLFWDSKSYPHFFCILFLQVPPGSGIGFQLACILVFNFLLTETQERTTCASLLLLRSIAISRHWILTMLCSLRLLHGKGSVPSLNEWQFCFSLSLELGHNRDFLLFPKIAIILGFCFVSNLWPKQLVLTSWALAETEGSSSWTIGLYFSKSTSKCTLLKILDFLFPPVLQSRI